MVASPEVAKSQPTIGLPGSVSAERMGEAPRVKASKWQGEFDLTEKWRRRVG